MTRAGLGLLLMLTGTCTGAISCFGAPGQLPLPQANPSQGKIVIGRAACGSCHEIPYVPNAHGMAGPPLEHFGRRRFIAGILPNSPDNLAYWLRFPQKVVPGNAMPASGLNESEARDAAAYLESLK